MAKKVIQVPIDEQLLVDLDNLSKKQKKTRSELIRQACLKYLRNEELEELDRIYRQGYMRTPEKKSELGDAQIALTAGVISKESW